MRSYAKLTEDCMKSIGDFVMTSEEIIMVASAGKQSLTTEDVVMWLRTTKAGGSTFRGRRVVLRDR